MSDTATTHPALIMLAPKLQQGTGILISNPITDDTRTLSIAVDFATDAEITTGTATNKAVTPKQLKDAMSGASISVASSEEIAAGTDNTKAVTAAGLDGWADDNAQDAVMCTLGTSELTLKEAIAKLYSYNAPTPGLSLSNNAGTKYKGDTVTSVKLSWTITPNGSTIASLVVAGNTITDIQNTGAYTVTGVSITTDTTYTAKVVTTDGVEKSATTSVLFYNKMYRGTTTNDTPTVEEITAATLVAGRSLSALNYTMTLPSGTTDVHVFFAYPQTMGAVTKVTAGDPDSGIQTSTRLYTQTTATVNGEPYYVYTWIYGSRDTKYRLEVQ